MKTSSLLNFLPTKLLVLLALLISSGTAAQKNFEGKIVYKLFNKAIADSMEVLIGSENGRIGYINNGLSSYFLFLSNDSNYYNVTRQKREIIKMKIEKNNYSSVIVPDTTLQDTVILGYHCRPRHYIMSLPLGDKDSSTLRLHFINWYAEGLSVAKHKYSRLAEIFPAADSTISLMQKTHMEMPGFDEPSINYLALSVESSTVPDSMFMLPPDYTITTKQMPGPEVKMEVKVNSIKLENLNLSESPPLPASPKQKKKGKKH